MSDLRALAWLTIDLVRRLLREPQVVRSLLWPVALVPLTLMLTVFAYVWLEGDWPVGVGPSTPTEVVERLKDEGFTTVPVEAPRDAVLTGGYRYATDGDTLWVSAARGRTLQVERVLREAKGARWRMGPAIPPNANEEQGGRVMGVIGVLFVLFGVVFGAAVVARDRDDGTLEAQLATGTARWIHGASRWLAGTFVLALHYGLAILVLHAILGVSDAGPVTRNGFAACSGGVAVGLLVIGRGGLKNGFSGPLATGLTVATLLAGLGLLAPGVARHVPIASLLAGGDGWTALGSACALGGLAVGMFTLRSARS
ncbi:MAG: ABC transporter permease subunit [Alphaproteobacteria bacterium]|nr:ABC transporter permease subunit [Alphaproteobacteria bacterium]MCB9692150.1 ABC transporter permease subunit [Alphaproteobacteria bacterium]